MASIELIKGSDGSGNANVATVQNTRSPGASTIIVDTVVGINPTGFSGSMGTPHTFTDPITSETITVISEATAVDFAGHVDGSNLEIDTIAPGYTDLGSEVGDIVIIRPTTQWSDNVAETLEVAHNDNGTLKDDVVTTAKIDDGAVTPDKRSGGFFIGTISGATLGTTGNKVITGVGFTPKLVRFSTLATPSVVSMNFGQGAMTATQQYYYTLYVTNTPNAGRLSGTDAVIGFQGNTSTLSLKASYVSMDADGFTINVSVANNTFDVAYEAYA